MPYQVLCKGAKWKNANPPLERDERSLAIHNYTTFDIVGEIKNRAHDGRRPPSCLSSGMQFANNINIRYGIWKDETYRQSLSTDQLALLSEHPAGAFELSKDELMAVSGVWGSNEGGRGLGVNTAVVACVQVVLAAGLSRGR